jgi:hypothetical protein
LLKLTVMVLAVCATADVVVAQLPGPFAFSFFNGALNRFFLLPFLIAGCG